MGVTNRSDLPRTRNPSAFAFHLQMRLYRACSNAVDDVALAALRKLSPPVSAGFQFARKADVIDYCYTSTLRAVNKISVRFFSREPMDPEDLKTLGQKKREREIVIYQRTLGENTAYPDFCRTTAQYINMSIPHFFGEKLSDLPGFGEATFLFRINLPIRYANYKIDQRSGYRNKLINSLFGKCVQGNYVGYRTRMAHLLLGKHNLEPLINFEHLLLKLCTTLSGMYERKPTRNLTGTLLKSIGSSLAKQEEVDQFLQPMDLHSDDERFIARLEWHKRDQSLPRGLPDPHQISLTTRNLPEKLDEALYDLIEEMVIKLLDRHAIISKKSFLRVLYELEGRDVTVHLLTYLIAEYGVKQLTDPHLFALAILYGGGEETAEYELDGFGKNSRKAIFEVGHDILEGVLGGKLSWGQINKIYEDSELRPSPGSMEGILQQREAKEKLREFLANFIYEMIKEDHFRHSGMLKGVRERASRLPAVGMATLSLHFIINGMLFSFGYLFRGKKQDDTTFLTWMGKHFAGQSLCKFLADRIVDLIYHPSWRVTLMQVIEHMNESMQKPVGREEAEEPFQPEDFKPITDFLFQHFIKDSQLPFEANIAPLVDYFTGEGLFLQFKELIKPAEEPLLEKALESLIPTIKELMLYSRVIDTFREERISFNGDAKFWEIFIRESLNQLVSGQVADTMSLSEKPKLSDLSAMRNVFVERLLVLDKNELREYLLGIEEQTSLIRQWEMVPSISEDAGFADAGAGIDLSSLIKWDYLDGDSH